MAVSPERKAISSCHQLSTVLNSLRNFLPRYRKTKGKEIPCGPSSVSKRAASSTVPLKGLSLTRFLLSGRKPTASSEILSSTVRLRITLHTSQGQGISSPTCTSQLESPARARSRLSTPLKAVLGRRNLPSGVRRSLPSPCASFPKKKGVSAISLPTTIHSFSSPPPAKTGAPSAFFFSPK